MPNNGSVQGSPTFGAAKFGNGLVATSGSNYILLPNGTFHWGSGDSWTVEAWLKNTSSSTEVAISSASVADTNVFWFGIQFGRFKASVTGTGAFAGGAALDSGIAINDGNLHHCVAVMIGGTTLKLFVDGVLGATFTGQIHNPPNDHTGGTVGRFSVISSPFVWSGAIDEVAIWSVARYTSNFTPPTSAYTGAESNLYALYHLQSDGTDSASGSSNVTAAMDDPGILYSPYNWNVSPASAKTINSGAYFRTIFNGTSVALTTDTGANSAPYSQIWARIDNQGWTKFTLAASNPTLTIGTGLQARKHLLEVIVKSTSETIARWSSSATMVTITGILMDPSGALTAPTRRTKNILIYGDSITEGVRATNSTATDDTDRNDALGDYSYALSTAVDAEVGIVAFGGQGVTVAGSGGVPALTTAYGLLYSGLSRSFSPAPDLVIYNLGTNDGGSITTGLVSVANAILASCPASKHLLLVPFNGSHAGEIVAAAASIGANATAQSTSGWFSAADSSDGVHPYDYSHVGLIAPLLPPIVTSLL